jgi:hypothetical protein
MREDGVSGTSFPARRTSLDAKPQETATAKDFKVDSRCVEQSFFHIPWTVTFQKALAN